MGSCFESVKLPATNREEMIVKFKEQQEYLCNEYGSGTYAGHIGIADGVQISNQIFKTEKEASDYVENEAKKWGPAIAVKVGDFSKVFPETKTEQNELAKFKDLEKKVNEWESSLVKKVIMAKSAHRGCKVCGSKIAVKYVKSSKCPVCGDKHFVGTETDEKKFNALENKYKEQKKKIDVMKKAHQEKNKDNFWYIGAWCAD